MSTIADVESRIAAANTKAKRDPQAYKERNHAEINALLDERDLLLSGALTSEVERHPFEVVGETTITFA